jgi:hypothetical protein
LRFDENVVRKISDHIQMPAWPYIQNRTIKWKTWGPTGYFCFSRDMPSWAEFVSCQKVGGIALWSATVTLLRSKSIWIHKCDIALDYSS